MNIQEIKNLETYSSYFDKNNTLTIFVNSNNLTNFELLGIFTEHILSTCHNKLKYLNLLDNKPIQFKHTYLLDTISNKEKTIYIYHIGNGLYGDASGATNTFSLAPNAIFMDTFGWWSFDTNSNSVILQEYNARSIVNYLYLAKTLSEHSRKDGKSIPISLFQLNGGNIPIKNKPNTYPMQYMPRDLKKKEDLSKITIHYNNKNTDYNKTSQFVTYIFGEPSLNLKKNNTPLNEAALNIYREPSNSNTNIKNTDFSLTDINIFDWSSNKIDLLKKCNINSILWGSSSSYTIAPFANSVSYEYGGSWVLFDKIKKYKDDLSRIRMGGWNNSNRDDISYSKLDYNSFINDSVATYTVQTKQKDTEQRDASMPMNKEFFRYFIWQNILGLFNNLDTLNSNRNKKNPVKPYITHYIYNGSKDSEQPPADTFKYTYLTNTIFLLAYCCLRIEIFGTKYYPSENIYGDICLSPDFYNVILTSSLQWKQVQGRYSKSNTYFSDASFNTDSNLKNMALNICNIYKTYLTKCSWNKTCTSCIDCPGYNLPSNIDICDKCTTCKDCDINEKIKTYFKKLHDWIYKNWDSFNHIIDMENNCIKSVNALIGFFLNTCGPHVNAGWDIGWKFNKLENGHWPNQSYTTKDFTKNIIPNNNLRKVINENGWIPDKIKDAGIADNTLFYLRNNVYGDTEQVSVKELPPIFNS